MNWPALDIREAKWVCVDVETTGLEVEQAHRVCEVAAVKGGLSGPIEEIDSLVNPGRTIPAEAAAVSGLTDGHVASAPPFAEIAPNVVELLRGAVIVAHNAPFDVGFLETELGLAGLALPAAPIVDTMAIASSVFGLTVRNLAAVTHALQTEHRPKHRAIDDARATRDVLLAGLWRLSDRGLSTVGEVVEALLPPDPPDVPLTGSPFPVLREALKSGADLRITYEGVGGASERVVRPIRLEPKDRRLLLAAFCRTRRAPRTFRVDRILTASIEEPQKA